MINLEKIGLMIFIKYMRQIQDIKKHLEGSFHELLMAFEASIDILNQTTKSAPFFKNFSFLEETLEKIQTVLTYANEQMEKKRPSADPIDINTIKRDVFETVIEIIDEEILHMSHSRDKNKNLKREALLSIKAVFTNQIDHENAPVKEKRISARKNTSSKTA